MNRLLSLLFIVLLANLSLPSQVHAEEEVWTYDVTQLQTGTGAGASIARFGQGKFKTRAEAEAAAKKALEDYSKVSGQPQNTVFGYWLYKNGQKQ